MYAATMLNLHYLSILFVPGAYVLGRGDPREEVRGNRTCWLTYPGFLRETCLLHSHLNTLRVNLKLLFMKKTKKNF